MKVGTVIQASCRKCGEQPHTVTTLEGSAAAIVRCNGCGSEQRYVATPGPAKESVISVNTSGKTRSTPKRTKKPGPPVWGPEKSIVQAVMSRPVRPYSLSDRYRVGDRVEHRTYGLGVVEEILGPEKVQVYFSEGPRVMVHGRPAVP